MWLGPQIEDYVRSLKECDDSATHSALSRFNGFVTARGVTELSELPAYVDAFVEKWKAEHGKWCKNAQDRAAVIAHSRIPVERILCVTMPSFTRPSSKLPMPFCIGAPGFFTFLIEEKGLRPGTLHNYIYTLHPFKSYLKRTRCTLPELTPAHISTFLVERAKELHKSGMLNSAIALRVFVGSGGEAMTRFGIYKRIRHHAQVWEASARPAFITDSNYTPRIPPYHGSSFTRG